MYSVVVECDAIVWLVCALVCGGVWCAYVCACVCYCVLCVRFVLLCLNMVVCFVWDGLCDDVWLLSLFCLCVSFNVFACDVCGIMCDAVWCAVHVRVFVVCLCVFSFMCSWVLFVIFMW